MQISKNFIAKNEKFTCEHCGEQNPLLKGGYRNHCRKCLYSLHVDKNLPGDRLSECKSLMEPLSTEHSGKKGWIIYHKCLKCGKMIPNKEASDDNFDKIIDLTQKNEPPRV